MTADGADLLGLAVEVAEEAGRLLVAGLAAGATGVGAKSTPTDAVSDLDRASEALILERILSARPDDAVLGEEGGGRPGKSGVRWIVDPLDGTVNFLYGFPAFCVSVAAEVSGRVEVGVVHDPLRGETFTARRGEGAWLDGHRLAVRRPADLGLCLVGTGFSYDADRRAGQGAVVAGLLPRVRDIRRAGSAALDLCWVGAGRLDAYFESGTREWDRAAGTLVAGEAGAWIGGLGGAPASDLMCVAAHPSMAVGLVRLLEELGAGGGAQSPERGS